MCNGDQLLKQLPQRPVLQCTASTQCWCNQISFRFPINQIQDSCMSPAEMLEQFGDDLTQSDKQLLHKLSTYCFEE